MGKSTELRNKIIAKLAEALQTEPGSEGYTMEACAAIALEVEGAMDAGFSKEKEYMSKGRSLVFNLQKNAELRRNVLTRESTAEWLVSATAQDLAPERLKLMREQSAERFMASRQLGDGDNRVVGWAAGTSGKIEWSQKFEEQSGTAEAKETIDLDDDAPPADAMDAAAPPPDLLSEAEVAEAKAKVAKARARMAEAKASSSSSAAPGYTSLSAADPPPRKKARAAPAPAPPPPKPKRATSIFAPSLQPVALASLWKATAGADGADAIDAADADANAARVEAAMGRMRETISDVLGGP